MCINCGDYIGGCRELACGALPPIDPETGKTRFRYLKSFWVYMGPEETAPESEWPCEHVVAQHHADCRARRAGWCNCYDLEDDDEAGVAAAGGERTT